MKDLLRHLWTRTSVHQRFIIAFGLIAIVFIALRITPSSYGVALDLFGAPRLGLLAGQPRPIRSDEWAVITPSIQATVNNHYQRFNATSYYKEDLRQIYALPVHDWGFAFRPTMWLFGIASPAVAFSAHHTLLQLMCLVGFALLFRRSGLVGVNAWLLSACVFWSGFTQYFWTIVGPTMAWWSWLMLAIIALRRTWWMLPVISYVFACWVLACFYPPLIISLGFVTACVVLAYHHNRLPLLRLAACGVACAVGALIALYYLRDPLIVLNDTLYPGHRRTPGGGMYFERAVSLFLPYAFIGKAEAFGLRESLPPTNICEFGVIGSVYFLFAIAVLSPMRILAARFRVRRVELAVLTLGLAMTTAWLCFPVPMSLGALLLWDRVPGPRMVLAVGVLLALTSAYVFRHVAARLTPLRFAFAMTVILAFLALKMSHGATSFRLLGRDLLPAVGLLGVFIFRHRLSAAGEHRAFLATAALMNFLCFSTFNPLQQADPIFSLPDTPELRDIANRVEHQYGRPFVAGMPGRVLNGLGYPAIGHVLSIPQLDLWRRLLPDVPEADLQATFNRYAHIILDGREGAVISPQGDVAQVPIGVFRPRARAATSCEAVAEGGGTIDQTSVDAAEGGQTVRWQGKVPAAGLFNDQGFVVVSPGLRSVRLDVNPDPIAPHGPGRDDYAFTLVGSLEPGQAFDAHRTCVLFVDERDGTTVALDDPQVTGECDACMRRGN